MKDTARPVVSVEKFLQYVSVPRKGINAIVGKNPLYINDFIFKKMMLPEHIKMILSTQVQIQIPLVLSEDPLLNEFDMSMDRNQSLMFVNDRKENQEKMYFRDNYRFCIDILNNLLYDDRKYKAEAVPSYGINFEEKNGKVRYTRK